MNKQYATFLEGKLAREQQRGLTPDQIGELPAALKPFQRDITLWALHLGKAAIFAGTGLGKTLQQLSWAQSIMRHTSKQVLILTPLAVAQQTVGEAAKFGIESVAYAKDQSTANTRIVVTNYDRVEKFDLSQFSGIVLDESSIIKSHESQTRRLLIKLCQGMPFRLCCTATPAPNDYVELGNHAEFLGVMTQKEMLATWFVHDGSIRATNANNHGSKPIADWRLKSHAIQSFWRWVSTWAVMVRHPRDIGYDEPGYDLPALIKKQITVGVEYKPDMDTGFLFPFEARTLQERLGARRSSIGDRVAKAAEIVNRDRNRSWLVWCNLNDESSALTQSIVSAIEVKGSHTSDEKAQKLLDFANGKSRILVSKPSIAGYGMNFQGCSDIVFVGLNDSFEQLYQAIRRCWRFGQTKPVTVYMIAAETEGAVVANLEAKEQAAEEMAEAMAENMKDLVKRALHGENMQVLLPHTKRMRTPTWLT